jgi:hypothetical protein
MLLIEPSSRAEPAQSLHSPNHSSSESKWIQATRFRELALTLMAPLLLSSRRGGFNIMIAPVIADPAAFNCYSNVRKPA